MADSSYGIQTAHAGAAPAIGHKPRLIGEHAIGIRGAEVEGAHPWTNVGVRGAEIAHGSRIGLTLDNENIPGHNVRASPNAEVLPPAIAKQQFHIVFGKFGGDCGGEGKRCTPTRVGQVL